jgi:hypothetical protein
MVDENAIAQVATLTARLDQTRLKHEEASQNVSTRSFGKY